MDTLTTSPPSSPTAPLSVADTAEEVPKERRLSRGMCIKRVPLIEVADGATGSFTGVDGSSFADVDVKQQNEDIFNDILSFDVPVSKLRSDSRQYESWRTPS